MEFPMKDLIIEVLEGSEPVDALQALIAATYAVADANGVSRFTLTELFSATVDAHFDVAVMAEEAEEAEEEAEEDEQTDN
jgi:hypothetical protein